MMPVGWKDYVFVTIQFALIGAIILLRAPEHLLLNIDWRLPGLLLFVVGFVLGTTAVIQMKRNITAFPTPKADAVLLQNGLYRYVRHPMYTALFLAAVGFSFWHADPWKFGISLLLLGLFEVKSRYEENMLSKVFPGYLDYKNKTGKFFPLLTHKQ